MNIEEKILQLTDLEFDEAVYVYKNFDLARIMWLAHEIRKMKVPEKEVGWIIDRNVNITNVCQARCKFCNFHKTMKQDGTYITSLAEYRVKIEEMKALGGSQLLLQGGLHPDLGIRFYSDLFRSLKSEYPEIKLHALGPPEIHFLSKKDKLSYKETLEELISSGLDSLPGAGAEILCDDIRKKISPGKAGSDEWLAVMEEAHKLNLPTSATMMYGHIESMENRIEHLFKLRDLQAKKPEGHYGFITFVPWPFMDEGTRLKELYPGNYRRSAVEYIRLVAISRIVLHNIDHLQASLLTVGKSTAQICLHGGADDLGSIMIEENVVSAAGNSFSTHTEEIQEIIRGAGFTPRQRNQKYERV
ncbi:MAG: CofH family radical SAM protein [Bacteroidales bacterium]|nr:CofH family radical SAM protein [Bacteroidales bacterium]MCF8405380.1 CofH family radical SAM protein [Bacteroidales bacterium]